MKIEILPEGNLLIIDYENVRIFKDKNLEISYESEESIEGTLLLDDQTLIVTRMGNKMELLNLQKKEVIFTTHLNIEGVQYIKRLGNEILFVSKYGAMCMGFEYI